MLFIRKVPKTAVGMPINRPANKAFPIPVKSWLWGSAKRAHDTRPTPAAIHTDLSFESGRRVRTFCTAGFCRVCVCPVLKPQRDGVGRGRVEAAPGSAWPD